MTDTRIPRCPHHPDAGVTETGSARYYTAGTFGINDAGELAFDPDGTTEYTSLESEELVCDECGYILAENVGGNRWAETPR